MSAPEKDPIEEWAEHQKGAHLQCRIWQHNWRPKNVARDNTYHVMDITLRCTRCGALKDFSMSTVKRGRRIGSPKITLPDGYQREKGMGRIMGEDRDLLYYVTVLQVAGVQERATEA